jgi:hypothetical protein
MGYLLSAYTPLVYACCKKANNMENSNSTHTGWIFFVDNANRFLQKTQEHVPFTRPYGAEMLLIFSEHHVE